MSDAVTTETFLDREVLRKTSPELTRRVSEKDWSQTAIGSTASWSPALRAMVGHVLGNGFGLLLWWGPAFCQIYNDRYRPVLGDKHPQSLGQPAAECWAEIWDVIGPMIEQPFHGGPPATTDDLHLEINRHGFLEETHFTVAYSPVFDETTPTGIGGVLATVQEITTKVIGERRILLLSQLGARTPAGKTADDVCAIAADVMSAHNADIPFALFYLFDEGSPTARLAAVTDAAHIPDNAVVLDGLQQYITEATTSGHVVPIDDRLLQVPGREPAPGRTMLVPILGSTAREPAGFIILGTSPRLAFDDSYRQFFELIPASVAASITNARAYQQEQRRAEALAEIDRAKNVFFSDVSHEFRTPLTLMLGPIEELTRAADDDTRQLAEAVHRNSLRLLKLVNTLLEFSRLESGRADAAFVEQDVAVLTRDLLSTFQSAFDRAGLAFHIEIPSTVRAFVDTSMWERIVLNLLSNALKFTLKGSVTVALRRAGAELELLVRDTGSGISESDVPHVFERFRRVRGVASRSIEGSGIGLALVHDLVQLHGGRVDVSSELGRGTTFRVRMPLGSAHLDPSSIAVNDARPLHAPADQYLADIASMIGSDNGTTAALVPKDGAPRVLVVDDNADLRAYVARILSSRYDVVAANNGVEALRALRTADFDVIVSDVMMPELDGFGLLAQAKRDDRLRTIPFIMLSARAGEDKAADGLNAGADDYLVKPFTARELLARVNANFNAALIRQEAATLSEQRFRTFADHLPFPVWQQDSNGAVTFTNQAWYDLTRLPHDPRSHTPAAWKRVVHPDDFDSVLATMNEAVAARSPLMMEYRIKPADGDEDAYRSNIATAQPQYDAGIFQGWTGFTIDIEDKRVRERVQNALRAATIKSERDLRALAEAIPVIVWTANAEGWIDWYNRGWYDYTGQTPEEAAGWGWQAAHHAEDFPRVMEKWADCIATGNPFEMEFRLKRADGEFRTFLTRIVPLRDDDGTIVRWYGSNVDIEEQKSALERSHRVAETLQGVFLPGPLPRTDRFRVDAVYQASEKDALVGGDWFDAIALDDGRLLVSIGDVAGHGLEASIVAGRLRHAVADFALEYDSPDAILRCVNTVLRREYPDIFATALLGFVDKSCSRFAYASAGHQPPVLARADGSAAQSLPYGGLPLGIAADLSLRVHSCAIARDDVLALYTDGLTEFARDIDAAERRLKDALSTIVRNTAIARPAVHVRDVVLDSMQTVDDAALLIVQFSTVFTDRMDFDPSSLQKTWRFHSSDAHTAHLSRDELTKFIRRFAENPDQVFSAELILGEILANTVEHAPGLVEVHVDWSGAKPLVVARDTGPGFARLSTELPQNLLDEHGRGLFLINALADDVSVTALRGYGTELRVVLPITRRVEP